MQRVITPSLYAVFFIYAGIAPERPTGVDLNLPVRLGLSPEAAPAGEWRFGGTLAEGERCELRGTLAHDTWLVRLTLSLEGEHPPQAWERLHRRLRELLSDAWEQPDQPRPWGLTLLYHALLPAEEMPDWTAEVLKALSVAGPASERALPSPEATPFGWLVVLNEQEADWGDGLSLWQRNLLLLTPLPREGAVKKHFLSPLVQGLGRIELYLQKAKYHARQQEKLGQNLMQLTQWLQEEIALAARTGDFAQLHREQRELEDIARQFLQFQVYRSYAHTLLNSLRVNLQGFEEHLAHVKLNTPSYEREKGLLHRAVGQAESNLHYVQVVSEGAYLFQDIQRGVEANRLQRASFLMSTTAVILAGVTIFNSFLDIWTLSLEGSPYLLPPAWVRIPLGLLAGVSLPLAAYGVIERRKWMAISWSLLALLVFGLAVLSTIWMN